MHTLLICRNCCIKVLGSMRSRTHTGVSLWPVWLHFYHLHAVEQSCAMYHDTHIADTTSDFSGLINVSESYMKILWESLSRTAKTHTTPQRHRYRSRTFLASSNASLYLFKLACGMSKQSGRRHIVSGWLNSKASVLCLRRCAYGQNNVIQAYQRCRSIAVEYMIFWIHFDSLGEVLDCFLMLASSKRRIAFRL